MMLCLLKEVQVIKMSEIIFKCPYCKCEVFETDEVIMGEEDCPEIFELDRNSNKVLIHVNCAENKQCCR